MPRRRPAARRLAVAAALVLAHGYQPPRVHTTRVAPLQAGFAALQRKAKEKEQRAYLDNLADDHPVAVAMKEGVKHDGPKNNCRRQCTNQTRGASRPRLNRALHAIDAMVTHCLIPAQVDGSSRGKPEAP